MKNAAARALVVACLGLVACNKSAGGTTFDPRRIVGDDGDPVRDHIPSVDLAPPDAHDVVAPTGIPISTRDLLVAFAPAATVGDVNALITSIGAEIAGGIPEMGVVQLRLEPTTITGTDEDLRALVVARDALKASPSVAAVALDIFLAAESLPPHHPAALPGWTWDQAPASVNWNLKAIRMPQAWNLIDHAMRQDGAGMDNVGIMEAFADFGVDPASPDLAGRVDLPAGTKVHSHATEVAGIIAAGWDDRRGIEGVYPLPTRILSRGGSDDVLNSVLPNWASNTGFVNGLLALLRDPSVRVINSSAGLSDGYDVAQADPLVARVCAFCDIWRSQVDDQGDFLAAAVQSFSASPKGRSDFIVTCSAGNLRLRPTTTLDYEARDNSPCANIAVRGADPALRGGMPPSWQHFIAVEAMSVTRVRANISAAFGTLSAPGVNIISTGVGRNLTGGDGTSYAAPHVAGLALYLWALRPALSFFDVYGLLTSSQVTTRVGLGAGGGTTPGAPAIDAFGSALMIDVLTGDKAIQTALVDVDDGTIDGNRRMIHTDAGAALGDDDRLHTPDQRRGDGKVSMADVRALRDALIEVQLADGTLAAADASLDGSADNVKRDLNEDGCVGAVPVKSLSPIPDCATATRERDYPRFDFNGDGTLDLTTKATVNGADKTDLEVLADLWPSDPQKNDGWEAADLPRLMPGVGSGDFTFQSTLLSAEEPDIDEIVIELAVPMGASKRSMKRDPLVWTVARGEVIPLKIEGLKGGVKVKDLCAMIGGGEITELPRLRHGEDKTVVVAEQCNGGTKLDFYGTTVESTSTFHGVTDLVPRCAEGTHGPSCPLSESRCPTLDLDAVCTLAEAFAHSSWDAVVDATLKRVGQRAWSMSGTMTGHAMSFPPTTPPGMSCTDAAQDLECKALTDTFATLSTILRVDVPVTTATYTIESLCTAAGTVDARAHDFGPGSARAQMNVILDNARIVGCQHPFGTTGSWSIQDQTEEVTREDGPRVLSLVVQWIWTTEADATQSLSGIPGASYEIDSVVGLAIDGMRFTVEELP